MTGSPPWLPYVSFGNMQLKKSGGEPLFFLRRRESTRLLILQAMCMSRVWGAAGLFDAKRESLNLHVR